MHQIKLYQMDYTTFKDWWLELQASIQPSDTNILKSRKFSRTLLLDYLGLDSDYYALHQLDAAWDGGIDLACFIEGEEYESDPDSNEGDTWFIVQSKYGLSHNFVTALKGDTQKMIDTFFYDGRVSDLAKDVVSKVRNFLDEKNIDIEKDKLVFLFLTEDELNANGLVEMDRQEQYFKTELAKIKPDLPTIFEMRAVSIQHVFENCSSQAQKAIEDRKVIELIGRSIEQSNMLVASVNIYEIYMFMKKYYFDSGHNIDGLYEKNVRNFLGTKNKINKGVQQTLQDPEELENFGLYNNGITIVVSHYNKQAGDKMSLTNPYIVNGCQTTKSIWQVLGAEENGGKVVDGDLHRRFSKGNLIVKIALAQDEKLLEKITRYTNSQNAVKEKDFISLSDDFQEWKDTLRNKHNIFLEIQRGSWIVEQARLRSQNLPTPNKIEAEELLKIFGAGWLGEAGKAFGNAKLFAPGGSMYKTIVNQPMFGTDDLYASFCLAQKAVEYRSDLASFKFLFCRTLVRLVSLFIPVGRDQQQTTIITQTILKLKQERAGEFFDKLASLALKAINSYNNINGNNSYAKEPDMALASNLNAFVKSPKFGKDADYTPKFERNFEAMALLAEDYKTDVDNLLRTIIYTSIIQTPKEYALAIPELQHLAQLPKVKWTTICDELNVPARNASAREVLKRWVSRNKPAWLPVPSYEQKD